MFFSNCGLLVTVGGLLKFFSTSKIMILKTISAVLGPGKLSELSFSVRMRLQPGHAGHQGCSGQSGELPIRSDTIGDGYVWGGVEVIL